MTTQSDLWGNLDFSPKEICELLQEKFLFNAPESGILRAS